MRGCANELRRVGGEAVAADTFFNPSPTRYAGHPLPQGERDSAYRPTIARPALV